MQHPDITSARSRYNARKTDSSLIAWICSEEWTLPTYVGVRPAPRSSKYDGEMELYDLYPHVRGVRHMLWCGIVYAMNTLSGEIDAK